MLRSAASSSLRASKTAGFPSGAAAFRPPPRRWLNLHEYQTQNLMREYGAATPPGGVCKSAKEARTVAEAIGAEDMVVKAQVLAGGRGKGTFTSGLKGGVQVCVGVKDVEEKIGHRLITAQTGAEGRPVSKVFVSKRYFLRREAYFAILLDRAAGGMAMVGSSEGGMDIEAVAAATPEKIHTVPVSYDEPPSHEDLLDLAKKMEFHGPAAEKAAKQMLALYNMFTSTDATLIEVNPLAETNEGDVVCLDGKANFDDNAAFRQERIHAMRDPSQDDPREVEAAKYDLNYVQLDGSIGCMVNGAGLAMATLDICKLYGGEPANFLDVGGGATKEQIMAALSILNRDKGVSAILVNIFGGIMRCDIIALGIIGAAQEIGLTKPIVVRLQGTKQEEGLKLLEESGLPFVTATDLGDAAKKAVRVSQICELGKDADLDVSFQLPM